MSKGVVLVPTDFSPVGDCALNHGTKLAQSTDREMIILHVVGKQDEVPAARQKVEQLASDYRSKYDIDTRGIVRVGNIFDDIGDAASELRAKLIIMGTHGLKGMQRFTGGHALKVITNSEVPFIIVQQKNIDVDGYTNIVLPLDLEKESKQKLKYAAEISQYFDSKIHLLFQKETDEHLKNLLKSNIIFAKKYLTEQNISFSTNIVDGSEDFEKEIVHFSVSHDADLIAIMNTQDSFLESLLGGTGSQEQVLITNEAQIPVLITNPTKVWDSRGLGYFS